MRLPLLLVPVLMLAGCAREDIVPTEPFAMDGVTLAIDIEPVAAGACDASAPYAVKVRWDAQDWPDPKFDFHIGSSKGQLWARHNEAKGEQAWPYGQPGQWFVMLDRNSGELVAAQPVPPLVCPPVAG